MITLEHRFSIVRPSRAFFVGGFFFSGTFLCCQKGEINVLKASNKSALSSGFRLYIATMLHVFALHGGRPPARNTPSGSCCATGAVALFSALWCYCSSTGSPRVVFDRPRSSICLGCCASKFLLLSAAGLCTYAYHMHE